MPFLTSITQHIYITFTFLFLAEALLLEPMNFSFCGTQKEMLSRMFKMVFYRALKRLIVSNLKVCLHNMFVYMYVYMSECVCVCICVLVNVCE